MRQLQTRDLRSEIMDEQILPIRRFVIVQESGIQLFCGRYETHIREFIPWDDEEFGKRYVAELNKKTDLPFYLAEVEVKIVSQLNKYTEERLKEEGLEPLDPYEKGNEDAANMVRFLKEKGFQDAAIELFCKYVDALNIQDTEAFAVLCDYPIAKNVKQSGLLNLKGETMFYLIYIYDTCNPGSLYGPDTFETCQQKMVQFVRDDDGMDIPPDSDKWIDLETGEGWYIIQATPFLNI